MAAMLTILAEGVAELLREGEFSLPIVVYRQYDTSLDLIEAGNEYRVDVLPSVDTLDIEARGSLRKQPSIDVALRYKFGPVDRLEATGRVDDARVDELLELLEDLLAHLVKRENRRIGALQWMKAEIRVPWHPEHLRKAAQYTGVVRLTYRVGVTCD